MTTIEYSKNHLKVIGHTGFNRNSKDIVCAGISAITMGATNWFDKNDVEIVVDDKIPLIEITLLNKNNKNQKMLELIIIQLKSIQKEYSKFVKLKKGV